jgi:hypothetical protein
MWDWGFGTSFDTSDKKEARSSWENNFRDRNQYYTQKSQRQVSLSEKLEKLGLLIDVGYEIVIN